MNSIFDTFNHRTLLNTNYGFNVSVGSIPHPAKRHKGGEDAFFLYNNIYCSSVGVADGVGGWAEQGVDPGIYSRLLLSNVYDYINRWDGNNPEVVLKDALYYAKNKTTVLGSSTATILLLKNGYLHTANLGDSGFLIIRNGKIQFKSLSQQHSFNFPYQLQYNGGDNIEDIDQKKIPIQIGDIIIVGTDGLFDNLYPEQIVDLINRNSNLNSLSVNLVQSAFNLSRNNNWISPFSFEAKKNNINNMKGGKMDDITVIVAQVTNKEQEIKNSHIYKPML